MSHEDLSEKELRQLLDSPGISYELRRTIANQDKTFDDSRPYPQERVDEVTTAFIQAVTPALTPAS